MGSSRSWPTSARSTRSKRWSLGPSSVSSGSTCSSAMPGVLSPNGRIHNLSTEDWERAFRVNLLGAVNGIRAAVPVMRQQESGSIVLTASVSGLTAWSHAAPVLRHQGGGDPARQGGGGRVRARRDPGQLRVPGHLPLGHPRRASGGRPSTPSPAGIRWGWGRPRTWWVRTPTWRATRRPGRPARHSSSTAGTPPPDPSARDRSVLGRARRSCWSIPRPRTRELRSGTR